MPEYPAARPRSLGGKKRTLSTLRPDLSASVVVFLVALPLCIGVAAASGVPVELGIVTGIVGGLVVGSLPGSSLQVSGPAAGLTVITLQLVQDKGVGTLGAVVLGAGVLQVLFGLLRVGRWFQAISSGVVQGMLAGIGAVLILGQLYAALDLPGRGSALDNLAGLPQLVMRLTGGGSLLAALVTMLTLLVIAVWSRVPRLSRLVPGSLAAVVVTIVVVAVLDLPVKRLAVGSLFDVVALPDASSLMGIVDGTLTGSVIVFALIASAETLFSASAVDRMHTGPRTRYNAELVAQGIGNTVCGLLGALPMTAVIVRSTANVTAGARTRLSRVLHGVWLLVFVVAVPQVLSLVPVAALAALLLHAGWKLLSPRKIAAVWREHRSEAVILVTTASAIVATSLFEGVLIGLGAAVIKTAWDLSRLTISVTTGADGVRLRLIGHATFLAVPRLARQLEVIPTMAPILIDRSDLVHADRAADEVLHDWIVRQTAVGRDVTVTGSRVAEQPDPEGLTSR
ncbi:SulP family inorganic anion transporter [Amycolatopsis sp. NPDC003861]